MLTSVLFFSLLIFLVLVIEAYHILQQYLKGVKFSELDWNLLNLFFPKKGASDKSTTASAPPPPPLQNVCTFSYIDLMKKRIVNKDNKVVEPSDIKYDQYGNVVSGGIDCTTCANYKYRTLKGCNTLRYDAMYSGTGTGLCTSVGFPDKCN
jgi:hypothetical protein